MKVTALIALCMCMSVGLALANDYGYAYVPAYGAGGVGQGGVGNGGLYALIGLLFLLMILMNPNFSNRNTTATGPSIQYIGG